MIILGQWKGAVVGDATLIGTSSDAHVPSFTPLEIYVRNINNSKQDN